MSRKTGPVDTMAKAPLFSFGVVTDVQYADQDNSLSAMNKTRYYREALCRLREAVQCWNDSSQVDFVLQLGDIIDGVNKRKGESDRALEKVMAEINAFHGPVHHTWGNHEFYNFTRKELLQMDLNSAPSDNGDGPKTKSYYSFSPHPQFLFILLDTYSISVLGYTSDHIAWKESNAFLKSMYGDVDLNLTNGQSDVDKQHLQVYNGAVDEDQLRWLDRTLAEADSRGQKVIICGHQPIHPKSCDPGGLCWNYGRILSVIHTYGCVCVYLCGHDHAGGSHRDSHDVLHMTLPGVVEAQPGENDFGTVDVYTDRMELHGHGRVPSVTLSRWGA